MEDQRSAPPATPVSFDDEPLIRVDSEDREVGFVRKDEAHRSPGLLHRALSVFLFDFDGRLLVQQRSPAKTLWPRYWSNSCCSHPRRGETVAHAAGRRTQEELGITTALEPIYRFKYFARFGVVGAEHEVCHVFVGIVDSGNVTVAVHPEEVMAWDWWAADEVNARLGDDVGPYTPWFRMEWSALSGQHRGAREAALARLAAHRAR